MGNGKDKCNFFAVKAWKPIAKSTVSILGGSSKSGSGWVSEIHGRFGVITFCGSNNLDERIYFTADKLFLYEKKLSAKQTLTGLLTVGDQISFDFEYVEKEEDRSKMFYHCAYYSSKQIMNFVALFENPF